MLMNLIASYYMARTCKYIARAEIGQYPGADFPVMPTSIMSYVNSRQVKREYRKYKGTFDSKSSNDLKLNENRSFFKDFYFFLCDIIFCVK